MTLMCYASSRRIPFEIESNYMLEKEIRKRSGPIDKLTLKKQYYWTGALSLDAQVHILWPST